MSSTVMKMPFPQRFAIFAIGLLLLVSGGAAQEVPPFELKAITLKLPKSGFATPIIGDERAGDSLTYNVTGQVFGSPQPIPITRVAPGEITSPWQLIGAFLATGRTGDFEGVLEYYTEESVASVRQTASDPDIKARWLAFMTGFKSANALVAVVQNADPQQFEVILFVQTTSPGDIVGVTPMRVRKIGNTFRMHIGGPNVPMIKNIHTFLSTNDVGVLTKGAASPEGK